MMTFVGFVLVVVVGFQPRPIRLLALGDFGRI